MSGRGALLALLEALRTKRPIVWNGDVLVVFEADVLDAELWRAQATMVLDVDDFRDLEQMAS